MNGEDDLFTERAFRTENPDGIEHLVIAGWDPEEFGYYVNIAMTPVAGEADEAEWTPVFDSRKRCNCRVGFSDITFILCRHSLTYPPRWAKRLLADNPFLDRGMDPDRVTDFGFHPKLRTPKKEANQQNGP